MVLGVGEELVGQEAHDTAIALAGRPGTPAASFPGGRVGMIAQPEAFAAKLHEVLADS